MRHVIRVSRRDFLGSVFSAGALVLTAYVLPGQALEDAAAAEGAAVPWSPSVCRAHRPCEGAMDQMAREYPWLSIYALAVFC